MINHLPTVSPSERLNIGYLISLKSNIESFVHLKAMLLRQLGHNVTLIATKCSFTRNQVATLGFPIIYYGRIDINGLFSKIFSSPAQVLSLLTTALRYDTLPEFILALLYLGSARSQNISILHASFGDSKLFLGYYISKLTGLPLTCEIHAHEIYAQPNPKMFLLAIKECSSIVTISNRNRDLLVRRFGINYSDIHVIKLGIDTDFWAASEIKTRVLSVSRFSERKGWHELFQAIQRLDNSFEFIMAGFKSSSTDLDLHKLVRQYGVEHKVTIFPRLDSRQLRLLMKSCDIFCLPSKHTDTEGSEGIPVVLMEAMAAGMQVISTRNGSIEELVQSYLIKEGSVNEIVDSILKCSAATKQEAEIKSGENLNIVQSNHSLITIYHLSRLLNLAVSRINEKS